MVENGGKHPLGSKALLYLPRKVGGGGFKSVENEYKLTKIKTAVTLYQNQDPTMKVVREFEEKATESGHHSLIKELDLDLKLSELNPTCRTADGNEVSGKKIGVLGKEGSTATTQAKNHKGEMAGQIVKDQMGR